MNKARTQKTAAAKTIVDLEAKDAAKLTGGLNFTKIEYKN